MELALLCLLSSSTTSDAHGHLQHAHPYKGDKIWEEHYFQIAREEIPATHLLFENFIVLSLLVKKSSISPFLMLICGLDDHSQLQMYQRFLFHWCPKNCFGRLILSRWLVFGSQKSKEKPYKEQTPSDLFVERGLSFDSWNFPNKQIMFRSTLHNNSLSSNEGGMQHLAWWTF